MDFSSFSYFNPRLREGGDNSTRLSINSCFVFQSTPPRRRRLFHLVNLLLYKEISIHASEKEATTAYDIHTQLFSFQSTPPRRRRLFPLGSAFQGLYFNPRLREGGDADPQAKAHGSTISIHASEKEATPSCSALCKLPSGFQSTPPRRRRREPEQAGGRLPSISIHASEKEATATYCDTSTIMYISSLNNFFVRYF